MSKMAFLLSIMSHAKMDSLGSNPINCQYIQPITIDSQC